MFICLFVRPDESSNHRTEWAIYSFSGKIHTGQLKVLGYCYAFRWFLKNEKKRSKYQNWQHKFYK